MGGTDDRGDDFDWDVLEEEDTKASPVFVCWYSGGISKERGVLMMKPLTDAIKWRFPRVDTLVLHFPDTYNIEGTGKGPWPSYVDLLVAEIDKEPSRAGRPLFILGHSRGAAPAITVSARLGQRVLKTYIVGSEAPVPGEIGPFELMSIKFKQEGDLAMMKWFLSLGHNKMLEDIINDVESGKRTIEGDRAALYMVNVLRKQFVDTIYPDIDRDYSGVASPIVALQPELDTSVTRAGQQRWKVWTSSPEGSRSKVLRGATHMGCLAPHPVDGREECPLIEEVLRDMGKVMEKLSA